MLLEADSVSIVISRPILGLRKIQIILYSVRGSLISIHDDEEKVEAEVPPRS